LKDYYSKYNPQDLWCIKEDGFDRTIQSVRESQFAIGNGYLGARGVLEEKPKESNPGTYIAGLYDKLTSQVSEMVNFPNPYFFKFILKGEKVGALAMDMLEHQRILNMRDGLLLRKTVFSDVKNRRYDYQSIRFVSMQDKNIGVMQIAITPLDSAVEMEVQGGVDANITNSGVVTEGEKKHYSVRELYYEDNSNYRLIETLERKQKVICRSGFYYKIGGKKTYAADTTLSIGLKKGQTAVFTKVFYLNAYDENEDNLKKIQKSSAAAFRKAFRSNFETLVSHHKYAWQKLWDVADVAIEGTAEIQKNLRFNIYHMLICAHFDNGTSSIGARTLSGEGYRGHIFWDAEIFMLPFYAYVMPDIAKNMLLYRYHRMDQARAIAKEEGYEGTMYPWESAGTGEEETPTWAKDFDGTIIKIRTNKLEHHITADIAYACHNYGMLSGDTEFLNDHGYELIFESARFWASRVSRNRQGKYEIRDVIGPDEFHEHVNNNAYTNMIAKWNLNVANKIYFELKEKRKKVFQSIRSKINMTDKEVRRWKTIAPRIVVHVRKDKVIEQFDGFFKKRHIEIVNFDENNIPQMPEGVKVGDYNKTQLVKQADVIMLLYLFSDIYAQKTKESNFWYYVNRTLHKSSLSAAMHSLLALEVGALSHAYQFFNVALRADISNMYGNSAEGVHAASLGGVWQCVVNGFAGIRRKDEVLAIKPFMPSSWKKIHCSVLAEDAIKAAITDYKDKTS